MKFEPISGSRRSNRRRNGAEAPRIVETFENRTLLTAPAILTPTTTVTTATPEITWEAVDTAVSYDVWISDLDSRKVLITENGLTETNYTPTTELNQGRIRVWVRANFAGGTSTDWSSPQDFIVSVQPLITGPVNNAAPTTPRKIDDTTPEITWSAAPGAHSFELFLSDRISLTSTTYKVANLTPRLDSEGNPIPDGKGDVLRDEIRSFEIPTALPLGSYHVYIRTTDDGGRTTNWSPLYAFEVAPQVDILRPNAPTFQDPPKLEWAAVEGATHYDLWVDGPGVPQLYRHKYLTTTNFQIPTALVNGNYRFWVRAIRSTTGRPEVQGLWSDSATFSKLARPQITGPSGVDTNIPGVVTVTDVRPTVEWTAIDKAVRYDIWVDRTQSPTRYLLAQSSTNSYTFEADIQPGNYWIWVKAYSTTGKSTEWSVPYKFTATGGAPVILTPAGGSTTTVRPTFTWTQVPGAASYEIWVSYVGVDFDYIVDSGFTDTSYQPGSDMALGSYRVWVRAIQADGTALRWSNAVNFTVASVEQPGEGSDVANSGEESLVVLSDVLNSQTVEVMSRRSIDRQSEITSAADRIESEAVVTPTETGIAIPTEHQPMSVELINRLAALCQQGEWWEESAVVSL
ncbi:MAG: hypothetical protein JNL58_00220 [Planctomyces sp.]|nr:hypothetical protein [Planctomyces sp.]